MSDAVARRLAELAGTHGMPAEAPERLRRLLDLIARDPTAPTTVVEPREAVDVHVADSLAALEIEELRTARRLADVGSGAGFPGLPLAVALPHARVCLLESAGRKARFLEAAIDLLDLPNAEVTAERAEEWQGGRGACDVVTARAVAPLTVLVEYAAPLLRPGGALVAWKGRRDAAEEADGEAAARATGLEPRGVRPVRPWPEAHDRHLHLYLKVSETPERFPRRPGMARKRPIRTSTSARP